MPAQRQGRNRLWSPGRAALAVWALAAASCQGSSGWSTLAGFALGAGAVVAFGLFAARLRAERAVLLQRSARQERLLELAGEMLLMVDADGHVIEVNPGVQLELGRAPETLMGKLLAELF